MRSVGRLASVVGLMSCAVSAHAGWYVIRNYEGQVGSLPIHASLQSYTFGSGQNLEGSYYYDSHRAPIPLYGKATGGVIALCEVHNAAEFDKHIATGAAFSADTCPFQLAADGDHLRGTWSDGAHRYDVALKEVGALDDTSSTANIHGELVIPYWGQTATHGFFGIYRKVGDGLLVDHIDVVNKRTGKTDQVIWTGKAGKALDQEAQDCYFGFYMTPIYMNVQSDGEAGSVQLNCYTKSSPDQVIHLQLDSKTGRYRSLHAGI
ncbi:hypothetical protein [Dyella terrae]|uniref:hypothetical protein n=1 Tax=Dyella terrae TaxID=522259 RepID=UPI001EFECBEC|nr:hypothetical protein [Dyella terrae]ULU24982.1 hypothetical protein DYST_01902 [Dyella terrae]ULU26811.1 hypothetical protein DYST_03759 [Dyella terrae]